MLKVKAMKDDLIKRSDAIGAFVAETNGVDVEKAIKVVDAYLQIRECDEVWDSIRAIRDCLECAKDEIAEFIPSADGPQKVIAQITFDEEKLREIVKEAVERFKEEYEIADRPQGKWIRDRYWSRGVGMGEEYGFFYKCSLCEYEVENGYTRCGFNYCPYCGARMKGADDA